MTRQWAVVTVLAALVAGCGGGPAGNDGNNNPNNPPQYPGDPGGTPAAAVTVDIMDNQFNPNSVVVAVGGTVTFRWVGTAGHSVTPSGSPSFSPTAGVSYPPRELVVTLTSEGTYHYFCILHGTSDGYGGQGNMLGTIVVR